jgi:hypothetical protein
MNMQHGHGHVVWTWTCSMDIDMQHGFGHAAWIWTTNMHGCWNADKKISLASLVFCYFTLLSLAAEFRHHGQSSTASHKLVR